MVADWHIASYHRRVVLIADRFVDGYEIVTQAPGQHRDGCMVRWVGARQYAVRCHRQAYGIGGRRGGRAAGDSVADRHRAYIWKGLWADCGCSILTAGVCLALSPILTRWMHSEVE